MLAVFAAIPNAHRDLLPLPGPVTGGAEAEQIGRVEERMERQCAQFGERVPGLPHGGGIRLQKTAFMVEGRNDVGGLAHQRGGDDRIMEGVPHPVNVHGGADPAPSPSSRRQGTRYSLGRSPRITLSTDERAEARVPY